MPVPTSAVMTNGTCCVHPGSAAAAQAAVRGRRRDQEGHQQLRASNAHALDLPGGMRRATVTRRRTPLEWPAGIESGRFTVESRNSPALMVDPDLDTGTSRGLGNTNHHGIRQVSRSM